MQTISERLARKTLELSCGCHLWTGGANSKGYGYIQVNGRHVGAHRVALELHLGRKLEPGVMACHHCDNPRCVNPRHMFVGTNRDNIEDSVRKGRKQPGMVMDHTTAVEIRAAVAAGDSQSIVASRYGISQATVSNISRGKRWV